MRCKNPERNVRKGSTAVDFTVECEWLGRVESYREDRLELTH